MTIQFIVCDANEPLEAIIQAVKNRGIGYDEDALVYIHPWVAIS